MKIKVEFEETSVVEDCGKDTLGTKIVFSFKAKGKEYYEAVVICDETDVSIWDYVGKEMSESIEKWAKKEFNEKVTFI